MNFITELILMIAFAVSLIFSIIALGLTLIVQRSELTSGPLPITFIVFLVIFIIFTPVSFFYDRTNMVLQILTAILALVIIIVGGILVKESIDTLKNANAPEMIQLRMKDLVQVETKEYKITVGAGVIGLTAAILYGIAKIIEVSKLGQPKVQVQCENNCEMSSL